MRFVFIRDSIVRLNGTHRACTLQTLGKYCCDDGNRNGEGRDSGYSEWMGWVALDVI